MRKLIVAVAVLAMAALPAGAAAAPPDITTGTGTQESVPSARPFT